MTQELQVLKCFNCETFQSHIVKKTNKWECKICGTKQSIKKVYGRGSGKDCRLHTQKLNALRGEKDESKTETNDEEENKNTLSHLQFEQNALLNKTNSELPKKKYQLSKWSAYLDEDNKNTNLTSDTRSSLEEKNSPEFTAKKRKRQPETMDIGFFKAPGKCGNLSYDAKENKSFTSSIYDAIKIKKRQYLENIPSLLRDDSNFGVLNSCSTDKSTVKPNEMDSSNFSSSLSLKWSKYLDQEHNIKEDNSTDLFSSKNTFNSGCSLEDLTDNNSAIKTKNIPIASCNSYFATSTSHHHSTYNGLEAKIEPLKVSFSHSDKNPENVSDNTKNEESEPSITPSLPVFEQDCDFNDSDFVLDF